MAFTVAVGDIVCILKGGEKNPTDKETIYTPEGHSWMPDFHLSYLLT